MTTARHRRGRRHRSVGFLAELSTIFQSANFQYCIFQFVIASRANSAIPTEANSDTLLTRIDGLTIRTNKL